MKKKILFPLFILIILLFSTTCGISPMEEGRSVNEYIFPYVKFELTKDDDGNECYEATILSGADVSEIYIPSSAEDNENETLPVKYFKGFESDENIKNLKRTTFESSYTEIKLNSLDQASILENIEYEKLSEENKKWTNLPELVSTEGEEFVGWFLVSNPTVKVENGHNMVPGRTSVFPKWGTHTFKEVEGQDPTCTEKGWEAYHYCTNKGCSYTTKVEIPALGHSLVKHEASASTCIKVGYKEDCWECERCNKFFSDETAETEIERDSVVIAESGHTADAEGYRRSDSEHWLICSVCGEEFDRESHTYEDWYESYDGIHRERKCTKCYYVETKEKEHNWVKVNETESTCQTAGHSAYWECTIHEGEYSLSEAHTEILNKTELDAQVTKDLLDHDFSDGWIKDGDNHWHKCKSCSGIFDTEKHEFEYKFTQSGEREFGVTRECIECHYTGSSSSHNSFFDITANFGAVSVVRSGDRAWSISYMGECSECTWYDENGKELIKGPEPFTISYGTETSGSFKVFCYAYSAEGEIVDIAFTLLTAY